LKQLYWGSHNEYYPEFVLTSFGDHFALPRNAFPDLIWQMQSSLWEIKCAEKLKPLLVEAGRQSIDEMANQMTTILMAINEGKSRLTEIIRVCRMDSGRIAKCLDVLLALDYVVESEGRFVLKIPVLTLIDQPWVSKMFHLSRQIMSSWLESNYQAIMNNLNDLTPLRYDVPCGEVFTQIWHYLFGCVDRQLVEAGIFADPYDSRRPYKGFIAAVWHRSLYK
jgi:hypothetical protein